MLKDLADELRAEGNPCIEVFPADVADPEASERINAWLAEDNRVNALVNSAGIGRFGPIAAMNRGDIEDVITTNLTGLLLFSQPIISQMRSFPGVKTVVNVSSDCENVGFPDASVYGATKGGLHALSKAWQSELRQYGIRVCNIAPGRVDTHFNNKTPGMRPGALTADEVAAVIEFTIKCPDNIELRQIEIDSMSR